MSLELDITEVKKLIEADSPLFKAASPQQQAMRLYPEDPVAREKYADELAKAGGSPSEVDRIRWRQQEEILKVQRRAEALRVRAFYAALPYTYDDIVRLNAYDKIMHMGEVTDTTTDIMKAHRTTCFMLSYPDSGASLEYAAYANGYLRSEPRGVHPSAVVKLEPAMTVEAYGGLLNRLFAVIAKADKARRRDVAYYRYRVVDKNWNTIDTVYYKRRVDTDYVKNSLIADGYDSSIGVLWAGVKRGEIVRETVKR